MQTCAGSQAWALKRAQLRLQSEKWVLKCKCAAHHLAGSIGFATARKYWTKPRSTRLSVESFSNKRPTERTKLRMDQRKRRNLHTELNQTAPVAEGNWNASDERDPKRLAHEDSSGIITARFRRGAGKTPTCLCSARLPLGWPFLRLLRREPLRSSVRPQSRECAPSTGTQLAGHRQPGDAPYHAVDLCLIIAHRYSSSLFGTFCSCLFT